MMLLPSSTEAQTYTTSYYSSNIATQHELIRYLTQLVAQLQAQLYAQQYGGGYTGGTSTYGIDVDTEDADHIDEHSASLYGSIDLGRASTARVWFDYGTTRNFGLKSLTGTARRGSHYTFRADVEGLRSDERYYYRAVAEDPAGRRVYGSTENFETDRNGRDRYDDEEPDVETERARNIDDDSAELRGEVDMNDFRNGLVFFVYGTDEDDIEDVPYDYDTYSDIRERSDRIRKERVDRDLDTRASYDMYVWGLDRNTDYYYQICVEYDDEDGDEVLLCGGVEDFKTDY